MCICAYVHMCTCAYVHMCICAYVHMCICAYVHMCICACAFVCMCACQINKHTSYGNDKIQPGAGTWRYRWRRTRWAARKGGFSGELMSICTCVAIANAEKKQTNVCPRLIVECLLAVSMNYNVIWRAGISRQSERLSGTTCWAWNRQHTSHSICFLVLCTGQLARVSSSSLLVCVQGWIPQDPQHRNSSCLPWSSMYSAAL